MPAGPAFQARDAIGINFNAYKAVTPSDTVNIAAGAGAAKHAAALWVGGAGTLSIVGTDGNAVTLSAVPAGILLPIHVVRVNATGTTATLIVALFRV